MQSALHITTKVPPGNRLEVQLPPGSEGQEVNVFVVLSPKRPNAQTRYSDLAEMAVDPDIQREIAAISDEFLVTEMDGLE
ncbi:hypothetical protein [cf. Phormidesmis sp. LEGE 11477]|uniref:hypothetical protein n=1 Tax=cf. Phormidesmis sp. LEGE 11477 TaxID=1828680 RepID=UPI00187E9F7E|nr:hypothetical protein [cf. Phormidesmis sp. LEGE 11477]MBE9059940.1 hypothetical protein [cf. Phormidesmis sp. LEGE 11477]